MPMQPIQIPQSVSWSASLSVVPRSAKKWARTAHLHEVKSTKNAKNGGKIREREKIDGPERMGVDSSLTPLSRREQERIQLRDVERKNKKEGSGDDVFTASSLNQSLFSKLAHHGSCDNARITCEVVGNDSCSPSGSENEIYRADDTYMVAQEMSLQDESDPWVDTDSASAIDDDHKTSGVFPDSVT